MPFIVGLIVKGLTAFLTRLLLSVVSEQMLAWMFFTIAGWLVKSTKTAKDDEWLEKLREVYQSK